MSTSETDPRPKLLYSAYINVPALVTSVAPPAAAPRSADPGEWPWAQYAPSQAPGRAVDAAEVDPRELPVGADGWAHDEVLFITVHQTFEVWFRHALFELDDMVRRVGQALAAGGVSISGLRHSRYAWRGEAVPPKIGDPGQLERLPELSKLVAELDSDESGAAYAAWIRELPVAGSFPGDDAAASPQLLAALAPELDMCAERVGRAAHIVSTATLAYPILQRMTPSSFLEFRQRLDPASGFGSSQFRELEIFSGQRERHLASFVTEDASGAVRDRELHDLVAHHTGSAAAASECSRRASKGGGGAGVLRAALPDAEFALVRGRMLGLTLRDLVDALLLAGTSGTGARALADRVAAANFRDLYETARRRGRAGNDHAGDERGVWESVGAQLTHLESIAATAVLAGDPSFGAGALDGAARAAVARLLDACLALDGAIMDWRRAHMQFVEVMIGGRPGTGGGGLPYLRATLSPQRPDWEVRSFPALWASRSLITAPRH